MVFDKIREKVRSKLKEISLENKKISAANKIIKERALNAALKEKEKQAIRVAEERQKESANRQITKIKQRKPAGAFFEGFSGFNYGTPIGIKKSVTTTKRIKRRGKKGKGKTRTIKVSRPSSFSYKYDVLGFK